MALPASWRAHDNGSPAELRRKRLASDAHLDNAGISGIIPAFRKARKASPEGDFRVSGLCLAGGTDGTGGGIARLSGRCPSAELEDELPVRQFVALVGVLDDVGQLAGIQLRVPAWSALGRGGHGSTVPRTCNRPEDGPPGAE